MIFTVLETAVKNAVGKSLSLHSGLSTNHFKFAGYELAVHSSCLFSGIFVHGSVPKDFLKGTAVPIPKGKNVNLTNSGNYRGITLSSVFGKLFDLIVLTRYSDIVLVPVSCNLGLNLSTQLLCVP